MAQTQLAKPQTRFWCYTMDHPSKTTWWDPEKMAYMVQGYECSGTSHIQGYVIMKLKAKMSAMKKLLPGSQLKASKGTPIPNIKHCTKGGSYEEFGTKPTESRLKRQEVFDALRAKTISFQEAVKVHANDVDWVEENPLNHDVMEYRAPVLYIWGKPGIGGNVELALKAEDISYFRKPVGKWFDGYNSEKILLWDNYMSEKIQNLAWFVDRGPSVAIRWGIADSYIEALIIVTTIPPQLQYEKDEMAFDKLEWRITELLGLEGIENPTQIIREKIVGFMIKYYLM